MIRLPEILAPLRSQKYRATPTPHSILSPMILNTVIPG